MVMEETREDIAFISWVTTNINLTVIYCVTLVLVSSSSSSRDCCKLDISLSSLLVNREP
jgi:hypothetical protein